MPVTTLHAPDSPWGRRRASPRHPVTTPRVNTYEKQLAKCERLYSKLRLDRPKTSLLPGSWQHILHSQSTVNVLDQPRNPDPRDIRSAPGTFLKTLMALSSSSQSHVTSTEQSHVISNGKSHVTSNGKSHVLNNGQSHVISNEQNHVIRNGHSHVTSNVSGHVTEVEDDHVTSDDDVGEDVCGDTSSSVFEPQENKRSYNRLTNHQISRNSGIKSNNRVKFSIKNTNITGDVTDKQQRHNIRHFWNQDNSESDQDVDSTKSDCSSHAEQLSDGGTRKRQHLDPDTLCDILRKRGLGDPRSRKPEPFVDPLPLQLKHQQYARRNKFYVEKLKGKSRLDCDFANTQAVIFCRRQSGNVRTASAKFRQHRNGFQQDSLEQNSGSMRNGADQFEGMDEDDEHEYLDEDQVQRIQAWIVDVNVAHEQKHHAKKERKVRITST